MKCPKCNSEMIEWPNKDGYDCKNCGGEFHSSRFKSVEAAGVQELTVDDYKEVIEDHKRLVRELDVIINGENAAEQASLCDIVGQLKDEYSKKQFVEGLGENEYYDLSDLSDEEKQKFIHGFMSTIGKDFLKVFLGLKLNTHMEAMIIEDKSKQEFILSFRTVQQHLSTLHHPSQ